MVIKDITENWLTLSQNGKFHAIFATGSIPEAIEYYRLLRDEAPYLKVTALFDPSIDNNGGAKFKEDGLIEVIEDYNERYGQSFTAASFAKMKKDIAARLAHKRPYLSIEREPDKEIDILIVVDQMLTGFDSKWINTLYLDKMLKYENIIQAFSRTNRLFGPDKQFGTIKYYRKPHTMTKNIEAAVKLYSGDRPFGLFAQKLDKNLASMNYVFGQIKDVFEVSDIENFEKLPEEISEKKKFADLYRQFNNYLEAAKVQGFSWKKSEYVFKKEESDAGRRIVMECDETTYLVLARRYKELAAGATSDSGEEAAYDIDGYLTTIDTDKIDSDYMNSRFDKFLKLLHTEGVHAEELQKAEDELHKTFATLSQDEQKYANIFLHDIQSGDAEVLPGKTFREYVAEYASKAKDDQIHRIAAYALGVNEVMLRNMMSAHVTADNINEFGRFDALKATADKARAKAYFEAVSGVKLSIPKVNIRIDNLLRDFILKGGFNIEMPE